MAALAKQLKAQKEAKEKADAEKEAQLQKVIEMAEKAKQQSQQPKVQTSQKDLKVDTSLLEEARLERERKEAFANKNKAAFEKAPEEKRGYDGKPEVVAGNVSGTRAAHEAAIRDRSAQ